MVLQSVLTNFHANWFKIVGGRDIYREPFSFYWDYPCKTLSASSGWPCVATWSLWASLFALYSRSLCAFGHSALHPHSQLLRSLRLRTSSSHLACFAHARFALHVHKKVLKKKIVVSMDSKYSETNRMKIFFCPYDPIWPWLRIGVKKLWQCKVMSVFQGSC